MPNVHIQTTNMCLTVFDTVQMLQNCWKVSTKGVQFTFVLRIWLGSRSQCEHKKYFLWVLAQQFSPAKALFNFSIRIIHTVGYWLSYRWVCGIVKSLFVNKAIFVSDILKSNRMTFQNFYENIYHRKLMGMRSFHISVPLAYFQDIRANWIYSLITIFFYHVIIYLILQDRNKVYMPLKQPPTPSPSAI